MQILNSEKLNKDFLINRFLPIFSLLFFIGAKFFFNFLLWQGRSVPPEPGDVFNYFRWIRAIEIGHLKLTSAYTAYTFIFGNLAKFSHISIESLFYYSFWIGFVMLAAVLWRFFKSLNLSSIEISVCFLLLAFYVGHGSFHGFYWVVPSFFSFVAFVYLFSCALLKENINWWFLGGVSFIFPLIHGTSIFSLSVFIVYFFISIIFSAYPKFSLAEFKRNIDYSFLKRSFFIILISFFSYFLLLFLFPRVNNLQDDSISGANNESSSTIAIKDNVAYSKDAVLVVKQLKNKVVDNILSNENKIKEDGPIATGDAVLSLENIVKRYRYFDFNYLNKVFPNFTFFILWILVVYALFRYKKHNILALYFSVFIFSFFSTLLHYKGYRSLIYLWPITYILIGCSIFCIYDLIGKINMKYNSVFLLRAVFIFAVCLFFIANILYSYWYISLKNNIDNIFYNQNTLDVLLKYPPQNTILYFDNRSIANLFIYKNYEKKYSIPELESFSYGGILLKKPSEKIVLILSNNRLGDDDKNIEYKKFLKKSLNLIGINTSNIDKLQDRQPDEEYHSLDFSKTINGFEIPEEKRRSLYEDDFFNIFELVLD